MKLRNIILLPLTAAAFANPIFGSAIFGAYNEELDFNFYLAKHPNHFTAMEKAVYEVKTYPEFPHEIIFEENSRYNVPKSAKNAFLIDLDGVKDVVVDGQGTMVSMDAFNSFLRIANSRGIVVKNFTVSFDRAQFAAGRIASVDAATQSFVFEYSGIYPALPSDKWAKETYGENVWGVGLALKDGASLAIQKVEELGVRKYRIFVADASKAELEKLKPGGAFSMAVPIEPNQTLFDETAPILKFLNMGLNGGAFTPRSATSAVLITNSSDVRLENITIISGPTVGIAAFGNSGALAMVSCKISNFGATTAFPAYSAMLFVDNRKGPEVSNCEFDGFFMYCIKIASTPSFAAKQTDELRYEFAGAAFYPDTPIGAYYPESGDWFESATVMSADGAAAALDKSIPNIVLIDGADYAKATQLFDMNCVNANFKIYRCIFNAESLCDIQARAPSGEIIENDFAGDGGQICLGSAASVPNIGPKSGYIVVDGNE